MRDIHETVIKSEKDIMATWEYVDKVYISCICITFNQEKYLERALNSILNQVTKFRFELFIHDDCSTDSTKEIILKYKNKYPNIIKDKIQKENMYSQGYKITPLAVKYTVGDFICFCEGDDYWNDESKLQKQIESLLNNDSIDLCIHDAICKNDDGSTCSYTFPLSNYKEGIVPFSAFSDVYTQFSPTASMFCRRLALLEACDKLSDAPCGDLFLEIYMGSNTGFYLVDGKLSVYNLKTAGSHANLNDKSRVTNILFKEKVITHLEKVANDYCGEDKRTILEKKYKLEYNLVFHKSQSSFLTGLKIIPKWFFFMFNNKKISFLDVKILLGLLRVKSSLIKKIRALK